MPEVGIRVLRDNLSRYISRVREGEEVIVTDHGKPVARIAPPRPAGPAGATHIRGGGYAPT